MIKKYLIFLFHNNLLSKFFKVLWYKAKLSWYFIFILSFQMKSFLMKTELNYIYLKILFENTFSTKLKF